MDRTQPYLEDTLQPTRDWVAHVDESGDFSNTTSTVLACGVLIDARLAERQLVLTTVRLRGVARDFPRPLHAAHLNRPVLVALMHRLFGHPFRPSRSRSAELEVCSTCDLAARTVALLRESSSEDGRRLERVLTSLWNGGRINLGDVKAMGACLDERDPDLLRRLRDLTRGHLAAVQRELKRVVAGDAALDRQQFRLALVLAGESQVGDAVPDESTPERLDRYARVLDCLLARMADVVAGQAADSSVGIRVQGRGIEMGEPPFPPFEVRDLEAAIDRARPVDGGGVDVQAKAVDPFDELASPWHVFADYAAFRSLGPMSRSLDGTAAALLPSLELSLYRSIGLPVRSGAPSRSHLATTGWAEASIVAARGGHQKLQAPEDLPAWVAQQALEWSKP